MECREELLLKVCKIPPGQKYYRRVHFSHRANSNCRPETVLHNQFKRSAADLLKKHLEEQKRFEIRWECEYCEDQHHFDVLKGVTSVKTEYSLDVCRPDIALLNADGEISVVIEIVVTHQPDETALTCYDNNGIILLQIDLESFDDLNKVEQRLQAPSKVTYCLSPICEKCGSRMYPACMRIIHTACWKCHHTMNMAIITDEQKHRYIVAHGFSDDDLKLAREYGVTIGPCFSKTLHETYVANICTQCHAFMGNHYLYRYIDEPCTNIPIGYRCFDCFQKEEQRIAEENWEKEQAAIKLEEKLAMLKVQLSNYPKPCPKCGGLLLVKQGNYGPFFGCCNYPDCRYTQRIDVTKL